MAAPDSSRSGNRVLFGGDGSGAALGRLLNGREHGSEASVTIIYRKLSARKRELLEDFVKQLMEATAAPVPTVAAGATTPFGSECTGIVQFSEDSDGVFFQDFLGARDMASIESSERAWDCYQYRPHFDLDYAQTLPVAPANLEASRADSDDACFNCGNGGHRLSECPEDRNFERIRQARTHRNERRAGQGMDGGGSRRYFAMPGLNHIPGQLSSELRAALGLADGQEPPWMDRMRRYGFPRHYGVDSLSAGPTDKERSRTLADKYKDALTIPVDDEDDWQLPEPTRSPPQPWPPGMPQAVAPCSKYEEQQPPVPRLQAQLEYKPRQQQRAPRLFSAEPYRDAFYEQGGLGAVLGPPEQAAYQVWQPQPYSEYWRPA